MKKIFPIIMVALLAVSCSALRAPARLDRLANVTERRAYRYNSRNWQYSLSKYRALMQEYVHNYGMYTRDEKRLAMNAIGRYHALLVKYGIENTVGVVEDLKSYASVLKDMLKEDVGAVKDFLSDVIGMGSDEVNNYLNKLAE